MHDEKPMDGVQNGLTAKQERFVQEYLIDLNATAAYKRAGYKPKSDEAAGAASARLLGNVRVANAVADLRKKLAEKTLMTAEEAWHEVACIAKADIGDILDFTGESVKLRPANEIPAFVRRAIQSVKVRRYIEGKGEDAREVELIEFKLWGKPEMLVTRLKALGELKEQHEHSGPNGDGIPIKFIEFARAERPFELAAKPLEHAEGTPPDRDRNS
jgi:phage terminase small subunit